MDAVVGVVKGLLAAVAGAVAGALASRNEDVVAAVVGAVTSKAAEFSVEQLLQELLSRAGKQPVGVLEDIRVLKNVLPKVKEAIWSAEVKGDTAEMRRALRAFVEDAEDILDEFDMQTARRGRSDQVAASRWWINVLMLPPLKVRRLNDSPSDFTNRIRGLYDGLQKLMSDVSERRRFVASVEESLRFIAKKEDEGETRRSTTNELLRKDFCFVGREDTKKKIMADLLSSSKPSVVLVTGMGGIGKTTLVQDILRQRNIEEHFSYKKWVCVGDELDLKIVTKAILDKDGGDVTEIRPKLQGQRFLIVLDDCWRGKLKSWKNLWDPLTHGSDGSKVLITSRDDIRSELPPASVKLRKLRSLSDKGCLQIFESYAFPDKEIFGSCSTCRLTDNEKKILNEKIKGLPLAATILGSSLGYVRRDRWMHILKEIDQNDIMSVLMWSYRRLPWYLKQCFAYLSVFPKDYKLEKEQVVLMWMAHDYVQPERNRALEDIAEDYFDYFVRASIIQEVYDFKKRVVFNMHDLVHDLAMHVSADGCFPNSELAFSNCVPSSHLSIMDNESSHKPFDKNKKLRTLLNICEDADTTKLQLQHVRVLLVSGERHLAQINFDELKHLRYLNLIKVQVDILPGSICGMYNLQTLLLNSHTRNFASATWNLPNLRLLMGGDGLRMTGIGNSISLRTIDSFNLFHEGEDIKELANLKELRGKLKIYQIDRVASPQYALEAQLDNKNYIEELVLNWETQTPSVLICFTETDENQNGILENLRPHQGLRTLKIACYKGDRLPSWLSGNYLPSLVKLKLDDLHHVVEFPPLGHLPSLEDLVLVYLRDVKFLGNVFHITEANVFPRLKVLTLGDMRKLKALHNVSNACTNDRPEYCYDIPCLQELNIYGCGSLRLEEWFRRHQMPSLQQLHLYDLGKCTNLVINYSRKCLTSVEIREMRALRSITLSNIVPLDESEEAADYPFLSVDLYNLHGLSVLSMENSGDGKITAGPLRIQAFDCKGARMAVKKLLERMKQDEEYADKHTAAKYQSDYIGCCLVIKLRS